jgi:hypothetical protein
VKRLLSCITVLLLIINNAYCYEFSGRIAGQTRYFFNDPAYDEQRRHDASVSIQLEFHHGWKNGGFTFTPFLRLNTGDQERTHADIRELLLLLHDNIWELRAGIGKVFWGVTESQHLVDIINQTDLVEAIDGEEKLGQPMVSLSLIHSIGTFDFYLLPYFRERTFPGKKGRLRGVIPIDTERTQYESPAQEYHIDLAVRYSKTISAWDIGLSHFRGTSREPTLLLGRDSAGNPVYIPYYEQISQTGIDLQAVIDSWLLKLEAIYRTGQGDNDFFASTSGFEYTLPSINTNGFDIGLLAEWLYDERGKSLITTFDNDIYLGMRIALNDSSSTEALIGMIQDINDSTRILSLESSRRLTSHWKIALEALLLLQAAENDYLYNLLSDDYILLELLYYF